jgi:hypothetical protein
MLKIQRKQCNQCLFSGRRIVSPARKREVVEECLKYETFFTCHKGSIAGVNACCKGYWDRYHESFQLGQLAARLGWIEWVDIK